MAANCSLIPLSLWAPARAGTYIVSIPVGRPGAQLDITPAGSSPNKGEKPYLARLLNFIYKW